MIAYFDTSMPVKLLVEDEAYRPEAERIWLDADHVACAEIGYVEARAALAAANEAPASTKPGFTRPRSS